MKILRKTRSASLAIVSAALAFFFAVMVVVLLPAHAEYAQVGEHAELPQLFVSSYSKEAQDRQSSRLKFHWEDRFSASEKRKLQRWLNETHNALEALVGELPFTTHIYMNRARAGEPVPWAHTERSHIQGVHFHVDPSFSLQEFRKDWTAPHELSHLVLPYVGQRNSWFAEGFASYMQYQVMHKMGVMSTQDMRRRYQKNLNKAESRYRHNRTPFAKAARKLRAERNYPTMYWGGAALFLEADTMLMNNNNPGLVAALNAYTQCCRMQNHELEDVVSELDRLSDSNNLSELLTKFKTQPGFPKHRELHMGPSDSRLSQ